MKLNRFLIPAFAFAAGCAITLGYPYLDQRFARVYSQNIYDCGISLSNVEGGTVSGFAISGHRYGFCLNSSNNIVIEGNKMN